MEVKINKEIRDYTEKIYFGLSLRQFIFSVLACIMAIVFFFVLRNKFSVETLSWICILAASPFAIIGFIKYNGMSAEKFALAFIKTEVLTSKRLKYKPINFYCELLKEKVKKGDESFENNK